MLHFRWTAQIIAFDSVDDAYLFYHFKVISSNYFVSGIIQAGIWIL